MHLSNNNEGVGGPLGATNKERDPAGDPTATFISKSWNLESAPIVIAHGLCFRLKLSASQETFSATVSTYGERQYGSVSMQTSADQLMPFTDCVGVGVFFCLSNLHCTSSCFLFFVLLV